MSKKRGQAEGVERRFLPLESAELRLEPVQDVGDAAPRERIAGFFAVTGRWSPVYGDFREQVVPGAFRRVLEGGADVRALWNHNGDFVLGRTRAGTLRLEEREGGLWGELEPPAAGMLRDLVVGPMARGDVTGASFAFMVRPDGEEWRESADGVWERRILEVAELLEVSPVTFPFYPETDVALRSLEAWRSAHPAPAPEAAGPDVARRLRQLRAELEVVAE